MSFSAPVSRADLSLQRNVRETVDRETQRYRKMAPLRTLTPRSPEETSPQGSAESKLLAWAQGGLLLSTDFARLSCTPEALVPHTEGRQASSSDRTRSAVIDPEVPCDGGASGCLSAAYPSRCLPPPWRATHFPRDGSPGHRSVACPWALDTHHKPTADLLQDALLVEGHGLAFPLLDPLLLQALAGVHFPCGPHLAGTHLGRKKGAEGTGPVRPARRASAARTLGLRLGD